VNDQLAVRRVVKRRQCEAAVPDAAFRLRLLLLQTRKEVRRIGLGDRVLLAVESNP